MDGVAVGFTIKARGPRGMLDMGRHTHVLLRAQGFASRFGFPFKRSIPVTTLIRHDRFASSHDGDARGASEIMFDSYHMPALVLTTLLLPRLLSLSALPGYRTLLWFLGSCLQLRECCWCTVALVDLSDVTMHPWVAAASQTSIQIALPCFWVAVSAAFSHWQAAYSLRHSVHHSLVAYSILFQGVFHALRPESPVSHFSALGGSGCGWPFLGAGQGSMPHGWGVSCASWWAGRNLDLLRDGRALPLTLVECANHFMTACC